MKLSELIAEYGDDQVQFQNLDQSAETLDMKDGITKITFGTDQPLTWEGMEKLGLVVWLDRKRVDEVVEKLNSRRSDSAARLLEAT